MIISEPLKLPTHCEKAAINGGTTAPPDIPIIISPESSFALSGYNCNAFEKMILNTLAQKKPTIAMIANSYWLSETKSIKINTHKVIIILIRRNLMEEKRARMNVPINAPTVRKTKYRLMP